VRGLGLTPDAAWLADPARQFPITIDPGYAGPSVTKNEKAHRSKIPSRSHGTDR